MRERTTVLEAIDVEQSVDEHLIDDRIANVGRVEQIGQRAQRSTSSIALQLVARKRIRTAAAVGVAVARRRCRVVVATKSSAAAVVGETGAAAAIKRLLARNATWIERKLRAQCVDRCLSCVSRKVLGSMRRVGVRHAEQP